MAKGSRIKNENGMNAKQQKFADRYILNGNNAAEAYRYAYNNKCTYHEAANRASLLMKRNVCISVYIEATRERLQAVAAKQEEITRERLITDLWNYATGKQVSTNFAVHYVGGKNNGCRKETTIPRSWAFDRLIKLLGYDMPEPKQKQEGSSGGKIEIAFQKIEEYLQEANADH